MRVADTKIMEDWLELLIKWGVPEDKAKNVLLWNALDINDEELTDLFVSNPSAKVTNKEQIS